MRLLLSADGALDICLGRTGRIIEGVSWGALPSGCGNGRFDGLELCLDWPLDSVTVKLLYGVQGTGNGHLTRARILSKALAGIGAEVTYLFSGRPREKFFDMEPFGDYLWRQGLTFVTKNGQVSYIQTLMKAPDFPRFVADVKNLDLSSYDLVITDFEPISAWATIIKKKPLVGIGHQYAFRYPIPKCPGGLVARLIMRIYAPAPIGIGLHWHHFNQPVLPPLVENAPPSNQVISNKILVYLPFESLVEIKALLTPFEDYDFFIYSNAIKAPQNHGNLKLRPLSRIGFQKDLADCSGVLCNSGFELISEALHAGKKILTKPLEGQWEQCCNGEALRHLHWGTTMTTLDSRVLEAWLAEQRSVQVQYPDVASEIADWLKGGDWKISQEWTGRLWEKVTVAVHGGASSMSKVMV